METMLRVLGKKRGLLTLAVAVTLLVRLVYGLVIFDLIADRYAWRLDDRYSDLAYTIATSGKYAFSTDTSPTMTRLPVHPLILAGIYTVFGRSSVAVRILQSLFCGITCILVYLTASLVTGDRVAGVASLIFALYPNSILYSARTLSETAYCLFLSLFCLTLVRQFKALGLWTSIASGLAFGVLILTKSTTVLFPLWLLLILLCAHYKARLRRVIGSIALMVLVAALVMSPWIVRNYQITGRVVALSTWGGTPFYQGYYFATHLTDGRSGRQLDQDAGREVRQLVRERYEPTGQPIDEYYQDRIAYALVWEKIIARPLYSFRVFFHNILLTWFLTYGGLTTIVSLSVHGPLLLLAAYAVLAIARRDHDTWFKVLPLLLVCAYFNLFHAVVYPHARYMSPITGTIVAILAAYGISRLLSQGIHSLAWQSGGNSQGAGA